MKRFFVILAGHLIFGSMLAYLTVTTLKLMHGAGHNPMLGWLDFTIMGPVPGMAFMIWLIILFAMDGFWLLFFLIWIIRRIFHIKDDDKTLYLP